MKIHNNQQSNGVGGDQVEPVGGDAYPLFRWVE